MPDTIVSSLANTRLARGWSQAALAERAQVSRAEISAIETGRLMPSVTVALRLAAALGSTVEALFGAGDASAPAWAWTPEPDRDGRVWCASIAGRTHLFPVEPTAAGVIPHDAWFDGREVRSRTGRAAPERTLVLAGCDPTAGILARELARHDVRLLPLLRSSSAALDLLQRGVVHAAGLHFSTAAGTPANDITVRASAGTAWRLLHQLQWQSGVAIGSTRRERSTTALLRSNARWVNREEGSAARRTFDLMLGRRRRPAGYHRVVRDHRAVAVTISSGWAEAGVCVRPAAADARLAFIPMHQESYELCVSENMADDPRVRALVAVLQSKSYREQVADLPGCDAAHTGDVRAV